MENEIFEGYSTSIINKYIIGDPSSILSKENYEKWIKIFNAEDGQFEFENNINCCIYSSLNGDGIYKVKIFTNILQDIISLFTDSGTFGIFPFELSKFNNTIKNNSIILYYNNSIILDLNKINKNKINLIYKNGVFEFKIENYKLLNIKIDTSI